MSDKLDTISTEKTEDALISEQELLSKIDEALETPMGNYNNESDIENSDVDINKKVKIPEYSLKNKRLHIVSIVTIFVTLGIVLLLGYYNSIISMILDIANDNITPANIEIRSVPYSNGGNDVVCSNSNGTYIYTDGAIINIDTNEIIIKDNNIENIACNDSTLIYSTKNRLYRYVFETNQIYDAGKFEVVSMKGNSNDVFVTIEAGKSGINQKHVHNVLYFHNTDSGINLDKMIDMSSDTIVFDNYTIAINSTLIQICYITDGEFEYTCGLDVHGLNSQGICRIDENFDYIFPNYNARRRLIEINGREEYINGIYPSQVGFIGDIIYVIERYGKYPIEDIENIKAAYKDYDAYFSIDTNTGDCKLLYKTKSNEQIVNFSTTGTELYILRDDNLYSHNLVTGREEYVFCNKGYGTLVFEVLDDTMYIFDKDGLSDKLHYITRMKVGKRRYNGD